MKKHFFDVTDIVQFVRTETRVTGIQRVAFEIIKRMIDLHGSQSILITYWHKVDLEYVAIPSDFIAEMEEFDAEKFKSAFPEPVAPLQKPKYPPTLEHYAKRPLKYRFHYLRGVYHLKRRDEKYFIRRKTSIESWSHFFETDKSKFEPQKNNINHTPVAQIAQQGDCLIILGAVWGNDWLAKTLHGLKDNQGIKIFQLVHDLIPIVMPEHVSGDHPKVFYNWLKDSLDYCSGLFANSGHTAKDLKSFMVEIGKELPIKIVPLAQKLSDKNSKKQLDISGPEGFFKSQVEESFSVRNEILNLIKTPFVLVVGTMETRKNVWRLAQAWQRLSLEAGLDCPKLVFAGKPGWSNDDFNQLMQATGNLGGWIQFADRPTDTELAFLYKNCLFSAMVSFYEGWGLPIGESLSFGKTVVVANNSSMPEVGGDIVEYCDAHSLDSIHAACRKLIAEPEHRKSLENKIAQTKLRTWDDVTSDFVETITTSFEPEAKSAPLAARFETRKKTQDA